MIRVRAAQIDGAESEHDRGGHNRRRAQHHLQHIARASALQLTEEQPPPKDADERIGVPQRKSNGQAHIANREYGERVGNGPQHAGQHCKWNQLPISAQIAKNRARPFEQRGHAPARDEYARHHAQ